jgi:hypothetical protein
VSLALLVHARAVLTEDVEPTFPRCVLKAEHRLGIEEVDLALTSPLVLATNLEAAVRRLCAGHRIRLGVASRDLGGDDLETDSTEW